MKIAVVTVFLVAIAAVCVSATSEPHCEGVTCDHDTCPKAECVCGSHKDACGCCDFCNKCAGEECSPERNERCAEGFHCAKQAIGEADLSTIAGHCTADESSTDHHDTTAAHGHGTPDSEHHHEEPHHEEEHVTTTAPH